MPISFNPMVTTNAQAGFNVDTFGYVQGVFLDDPSLRVELRGGFIPAAQTTPIWGGLPVALSIPILGQNHQGPAVTTATTIAGIRGWCVYNQASNGIISASSPVPFYSAGMTCNFVEVGSGLRVALPIANSLLNTLASGTADQSTQVAWDFTANQIIAYTSGTALPVKIQFLTTAGKGIVYNSGTGFAAWNETSSLAVCEV